MTFALMQLRRQWLSRHKRKRVSLRSFKILLRNIEDNNKTQCKKNTKRRQCEDRLRKKERGTSSECYCKTKRTNDESSLPSSRKTYEKENIENKLEKIIERVATIDLGIESPVKNKFETKILESPTLSPDTQNAIENAEKILEEARYRITEVTKLSTTRISRGVKKELYADDMEPPLEDEIEENLYIRELVSSRLNKINNEITEVSEISTDSNKIVKNKIIKKRSVDLLAPKFRTIEQGFGDIFCRSMNRRCKSFEHVEFDKSKFVVANETKKDDLPNEIKIQKTQSLTVQKGPPLNIERKLRKQNLGFVHISPDVSFVQDKTNIKIYSFCHKSCAKKDTSLTNMADEGDKESIDIVASDVIDGLASKNQIATEKVDTFEEQSASKDNVVLLTDVAGKKNDVLYESPINSGSAKEDRENVSEHLPETGADCFTLKDKPNSYLNDRKKNEENAQGEQIIAKVVNCESSLNEDERIDEIKSVDNDKEKYRKNRVSPVNNIKTTHKRGLNKELYSDIDKRFSEIIEKYDSHNKISNKTNELDARKESIDLSDISLLETDSSLSEIELSPPSIETFDNILSTYDKIIDRVYKSDKEIEETLKQLELTLANKPLETFVSNTKVKSYDLVPVKKDDKSLMKLNLPNSSRYINESNSTVSLSDESRSAIVDRNRDKFVVEEEDSFLSNKTSDLKNESRSIKKRKRKINDVAIKSNEPANIVEITANDKTLELKDKVNASPCDEKLKTVETWFLKNEERQDNKFDYERTIVHQIVDNCLSSTGHRSSLTLEDATKHLQSFSNTRSQDIPSVFKNLIIDIIKRETDLIFDFVPKQKRENATSRLEETDSFETIEPNVERKFVKDFTVNNQILQELPLTRILERKERSLKVCPLNSIEIKPTRNVIDELSQTEINVLEKGTQYEIVRDKKPVESDDKMLMDVNLEENGTDNISQEKNQIKEYSKKETKIDRSEILKVDSIINDNFERNNIILSDKVLDKSSNSDSRSSRINVKRVNCLTTTSSETSHSEGELFLPSSCSYSLGEIRMIKNSTSICNHALVSTSSLTGFGETTSLLRHSSGEIYVDSSDTL